MKKHLMVYGTHDEEKKSCFDCKYNECALFNCFCDNRDAIKERGTRIADNENCSFWTPCLTLKDLNEHKKWYHRFIRDERAENYIHIIGNGDKEKNAKRKQKNL